MPTTTDLLGVTISQHCPGYMFNQLKKQKIALSCLNLVISWTIACQAPLSMGFSRQEYWSGLPFPSPGDLPDPGIEPMSPALQVDALPTELCTKPLISYAVFQIKAPLAHNWPILTMRKSRKTLSAGLMKSRYIPRHQHFPDQPAQQPY